MSERYPRIRIYSIVPGGKYLAIRDCVSISFYIRHAHSQLIQGVQQALEVYRRAVGPQVLEGYLDDEGDFQSLDEEGWALIQRKLLEPLKSFVCVAGGSDELCAYEFYYHGRIAEDIDKGRASMLSVFLPTEYLEAHGPGRVRELALEMASQLPFTSGHAGLAILHPEALVGVSEHIHDDALRYPGLDVPDSDVSRDIGDRVKGAYWLTFLGQPVLGELGGVAGLRSRLHSPGSTVQELEGERAVVTLGAWPEAGDSVQGRPMPAYTELARVLEPWLYQHRFAFRGFTPEEMRRWERRFLAEGPLQPSTLHRGGRT